MNTGPYDNVFKFPVTHHDFDIHIKLYITKNIIDSTSHRIIVEWNRYSKIAHNLKKIPRKIQPGLQVINEENVLLDTSYTCTYHEKMFRNLLALDLI